MFLRGGALALGAPFINRGSFRLFAHNAPQVTYSATAIELVQRSTVIDMLGLLTLDYRKLTGWQARPDLFDPAQFQRIRNSGINIFHPAVGFTEGDVYTSSLADITGWNAFLAGHPEDFVRVDSIADLACAKASERIGIVIGQQNSKHFRTALDVDRFYRLGQRVSQLTYFPNRIGGGSAGGPDTGLTPFGAEIVERMNHVGMAIDVSHCGDRTTLDAIEASKKPVLVTHSNCRALVPSSSRCKTDEAIRKVAARGGVIGVTMVRCFVGADATVTIEDMLDHIDHAAQVAGVEHVGLGSDVDLDGRDTHGHPQKKYDLDGIDYSKKVFDLTDGLLRRNYSSANIELILGGNFARALSEIWTA